MPSASKTIERQVTQYLEERNQDGSIATLRGIWRFLSNFEDELGDSPHQEDIEASKLIFKAEAALLKAINFLNEDSW